jgi:hypothetical protein
MPAVEQGYGCAGGQKIYDKLSFRLSHVS